MNATEIDCKLIENAKNQVEMDFNARMEQIHKEQLAEKNKEIEKLKNGIYKILKLNEYMIHCESKKVIYKFLIKQWRIIYETLGIPKPGLARCSKELKGDNSNE